MPHIEDQGRDGELLSELNRVKCLFQARSIAAVLGAPSTGHYFDPRECDGGSDDGSWGLALLHSVNIIQSDSAVGGPAQCSPVPAQQVAGGVSLLAPTTGAGEFFDETPPHSHHQARCQSPECDGFSVSDASPFHADPTAENGERNHAR